MIILPDTDAWVKLLNPGETPVKERFRKADPKKNKILFCGKG